MRLLALDFDGVICDSAPEAYLVALRSYLELHPHSALASSGERSGWLSGPAPARARVLADPLYAAFLEAMPLGNRAEDYEVCLRAIESGRSLPDQAAYDAFRAGIPPEELAVFHQRFYRQRARLSAEDPAAWRGLTGPYPEFVALLRRRAGHAVLAIATSKDRRSVRMLLGLFGIDDLFPEERVLDKEAGVRKTAHLAELRRRTGCAFGDMVFVDDKLNHLLPVAELGVRCALAAWGYNGPREVRAARARGYAVCDLEGAEAALFDRTAPAGLS